MLRLLDGRCHCGNPGKLYLYPGNDFRRQETAAQRRRGQRIGEGESIDNPGWNRDITRPQQGELDLRSGRRIPPPLSFFGAEGKKTPVQREQLALTDQQYLLVNMINTGSRVDG
jgi:hypothetical protein